MNFDNNSEYVLGLLLITIIVSTYQLDLDELLIGGIQNLRRQTRAEGG